MLKLVKADAPLCAAFGTNCLKHQPREPAPLATKETEMLATKEHYDLIAEFEKSIKRTVWVSGMRFDKEPKESWAKGQIYQSGEVNNLFKVFRLGYSLGKTV